MFFFKMCFGTILFFFLNEQGCRKTTNDSLLYGVAVIKNIQLVTENKDVSYFNDTFHVYTFENYVFYHISYDFDSTVNDLVIKAEARSAYFIYKKGSIKGYYYDESNNKKSRAWKTDSFVSMKKISIANELLTPVITQYDSLTKKSIETYVYNTGNNTRNDTMLYSYSKNMKMGEYSLSKFLDSTRKSKLYRIELIPGSIEKGQENNGNFKAVFEIKEMGYINKNEAIYSVFYKVKNIYENLK